MGFCYVPVYQVLVFSIESLTPTWLHVLYQLIRFHSSHCSLLTKDQNKLVSRNQWPTIIWFELRHRKHVGLGIERQRFLFQKWCKPVVLLAWWLTPLHLSTLSGKIWGHSVRSFQPYTFEFCSDFSVGVLKTKYLLLC